LDEFVPAPDNIIPKLTVHEPYNGERHIRQHAEYLELGLKTADDAVRFT